jgi:hypothetical protein
LDCKEAHIYFASAADLKVQPRFAAFPRAEMRHSGAIETERCIKSCDFGPSLFCPGSRSFPLSFSQSGGVQTRLEIRSGPTNEAPFDFSMFWRN